MKNFSIEAASIASHEIMAGLKDDVPYINISCSKLACEASIFITISFDPKENWAYGILQNSLYARFVIHPDGKLSLFAGRSGLAKFRKCNVVSPSVVVGKIKNWINESNKLLGR